MKGFSSGSQEGQAQTIHEPAFEKGNAILNVTFVIAGLVRVVQGRRYLNTIGCNRAMFTFAQR